MIPDFEDKVVFDCGACCGLDAILFTREKARHVYCLEPDTKNFENLVTNTRGYPITCIQKALFKHNGQVEFSCENTQGSMILGKSIDISVDNLKKIRKCSGTMVDCVTLDRMVELYGNPDIVKIDIEGSEYDLIGSMDKLLELGPKIIFEIHQRIPKIEYYNKLVEHIKSFGYTIHFYTNEIVGDHILCVK
jgi:FkbM family methyltransferase